MKIEGLAEPLEAIQATAESLTPQMAELQARADALDDSVSQLELLEKREEELGKAQKDLEETLARSSSAADHLGDRVGKIHSQVEALSSAEKLMEELLDPKGDVTRIRGEVDELMVDVSRLEVRSNAFAEIEGRLEAISE